MRKDCAGCHSITGHDHSRSCQEAHARSAGYKLTLMEKIAATTTDIARSIRHWLKREASK